MRKSKAAMFTRERWRRGEKMREDGKMEDEGWRMEEEVVINGLKSDSL